MLKCLFRKHEWYGCEKEKIPKRGKDDMFTEEKKIGIINAIMRMKKSLCVCKELKYVGQKSQKIKSEPQSPF